MPLREELLDPDNRMTLNHSADSAAACSS